MKYLKCDHNRIIINLVMLVIGRFLEAQATEHKPNSIDDYAKDGGEELLPRCTAFFNRIPTESLWIRNSNAMHLGKKFLAAIFSVIVYSKRVKVCCRCYDNSGNMS